MRILVALAFLGFTLSIACAQDAGQVAAQQAMQAAQNANQIVQQQMQQATQLATQNTINNASTSLAWGCCQLAATPKFSLKPGAYSGSTTVKIHDHTRGATIYYTTDGWTPTTNSNLYTGPLTLDATTTLQAVAIAPNCSRSLVAVATYTFSSGPTSQPAAIQAVTPGSGRGPLLANGTPVPLVFAQDVNSKSADVGDKIQLSLDADVMDGDRVIVHKGAIATAVITAVDHTGAGGMPGEIAFKVDSLEVNGITVALRGTAAKEGQTRLPNAAVMIPVVGPFTVLKHGKDAVIKKGTPFVAYVNTDTTLVASR